MTAQDARQFRSMPAAPLFPVLPILEGEIVPVDLDAVQDRLPRVKVQGTRELVPVPVPVPVYATQPVEVKRGLIRRAIDDPYWILMSFATALGLSIVGTVVYGIVQVVLAVVDAVTTYGPSVVRTSAVVGIVLVLLAICGGGAAKCAGIHCGGCRR